MERAPGAVEPDDLPAAAVPRPAATVVLLRPGADGPEVLLTRRPSTMAFAADVHVFPGGAVDSGDGAPEAVARSRVGPDAAAHALGGESAPDGALAAFVAGVRELWEEAGVALVSPRRGAPMPSADALERARDALLAGTASIGEVAASLDVTLRTDLLAPLSRWVTPPFVPRRFDVRFFVAELPAGIEPTFRGGEVVEHRWATPRAALDAMAAGEIGLWVPTSATLQQLEFVPSFEDVRERLAPGPASPIRLEDLELGGGMVRLVLPGAGGICGQSVNAWVVGSRRLVVVDPGDPSEAAADALLALASGRTATIEAVAITHADPDHAAGAEALALRLGVPLFGGPGARHDLPAALVEVSDGDRVPAGDAELVALAAPGPRVDHVAFVAPEAAAVLVGDLVGPGPTRSILGPPDVPAWLASLERVDALAARRLLPGHGAVPPDARAAIDTQRRRLPPA
jgi:ribonuclease/clavin/mitogillin